MITLALTSRPSLLLPYRTILIELQSPVNILCHPGILRVPTVHGDYRPTPNLIVNTKGEDLSRGQPANGRGMPQCRAAGSPGVSLPRPSLSPRSGHRWSRGKHSVRGLKAPATTSNISRIKACMYLKPREQAINRASVRDAPLSRGDQR